MYYYLYQVTNLKNNKIYVGVHKTKSLDDGYMGSGKVIRRAIKSHGVENFKKDILETFEDSKAMYAREKEVVNEDFLAREDVYNLRRGGHGGFDHLTTEQIKQAGRLGGSHSAKLQQELKIGIFSDTYVSYLIRNKEFQGKMAEKAQSPEAKLKRKNTREKTQFQLGIKNSQFGTMWITNGSENKKIKKEELIPDEWYKGRKQNKLCHASIVILRLTCNQLTEV